MRFVLLFLLLGNSWSAWAQLSGEGRLELPVQPNKNEKYVLLTLGERGGLISHHVIDDFSRQPHRFRFTRLDTALHVRWQIEYRIPERYVPLQTFDNEQYLFHLYTQPNSDKIAVFRLNIEEGTGDFFEGQMPTSLDVGQFKVMGNTAYLGGYYRSRPVVMGFSFFDRSMRVFQGLYVNNIELGSMEVDPFRQEVHVLTSSPKKRCQFAVRSYSPDGKPLRVIEYDGTQQSLITGKILPISADESLLVGNYSADCTPYSQGIYVTRIHHNETGKLAVTTDNGADIRYFDFSKLKNFFNFMKPRRQRKLLARVLKKRQLGKDYKFHYRLLVHELMPTPTGLRVVAEVYYPQYRGSAYASSYNRNLFLYSPNSLGALSTYTPTPRPGSDRNSMGYQFTHAFICEFDQEGNLIWDNCLPIKELNSLTLTPKVQVLPQEKQVVLAYMKDNETTTQLIERDSVIRNDNPIKTRLLPNGETILDSGNDNIQAWFGPYFIATGYQKVGPARGTFGLPRDVFYLTKLRYNVTPPPVATTQVRRTHP